MEPAEEEERVGPVDWTRPVVLTAAMLLVLALVVWLQLGGGSALVMTALHPPATRDAHPGQKTASLSPSAPALKGISPPPRIAAALVPQIADKLPGALLFGGRTAFRGANCVPDLWQWNSSGWVQLHTAVKLPCIEPHFEATTLAAPGSSAAAQIAGRRLVLTASTCGVCPIETWTTADGVDWQRYPGASPTARRDYSVALDALDGTIVLFGGMAADTGRLLGDTWTWDGNRWALRNPLHSPPARARASAASSYATSVGVVLFGGVGAQGDLADTWEWTGQDWLERRTAHSPAPREWASMAFGIAAGGTILVGGVSLDTYVADTWSWDRTDWTPINPRHRPSPRAAAAFASDSQGDLVLFGGDENAKPNNETWTFDGRDWTFQLG